MKTKENNIKEMNKEENHRSFLGLSEKTIHTMLGMIDDNNQDFTFLIQLTIRKIRASFDRIFNHIHLKKGNLIARSLIDN